LEISLDKRSIRRNRRPPDGERDLGARSVIIVEPWRNGMPGRRTRKRTSLVFPQAARLQRRDHPLLLAAGMAANQNRSVWGITD
jgi:hypothetical protein